MLKKIKDYQINIKCNIGYIIIFNLMNVNI